ncbi:hypothetical protein BC829DRAFT_254965 [Chytridium lagenaria]|nr:hypothetical protein BC829DRAFT_254965 [Chytridium lagenaria]
MTILNIHIVNLNNKNMKVQEVTVSRTSPSRCIDKPTLVVLIISSLLFVLWILFLHPDYHRNPNSILSFTQDVADMEPADFGSAYDDDDHYPRTYNDKTFKNGRLSFASGVHDLTGSDSPEDQCDHSGKTTFGNRHTGRLFGTWGIARSRQHRRKCPLLLQESMVNVSMLYNEEYLEERRKVTGRIGMCGNGGSDDIAQGEVWRKMKREGWKG